MSQPKIVLVVLVLIGLLFFLTVGLGLTQESDRSRHTQQQREAAQDGNFQPPNWTQNLGELLAPFSPKVTLNFDTGSLAAGDQFDLSPGTTETFQILTSQRPIRVAQFRVYQGQAVTFTYQNAAPNPLTDRQEPLTLPDWERSRIRGSLVIAEEGGTLQIACQDTAPCRIELQ